VSYAIKYIQKNTPNYKNCSLQHRLGCDCFITFLKTNYNVKHVSIIRANKISKYLCLKEVLLFEVCQRTTKHGVAGNMLFFRYGLSGPALKHCFLYNKKSDHHRLILQPQVFMDEQFIPLALKPSSCGTPSIQRLPRCVLALKANIGRRFPVFKKKVIKKRIVRILHLSQPVFP